MATYNVTDNFITPDLQPGDKLLCTYSGHERKVTLPNGKYRLEVWGADNTNYAWGGYSTGDILLTDESTDLWLYAGGRGVNAWAATGGWNGGGNGVNASYSGTSTTGTPGGGASDIRINGKSLYQRVIVAGGAGGYSNRVTGNVNYGGGEAPGYRNGGQKTSSVITGGSVGNGVAPATNYKYGAAGGGGGFYGGTNMYSDSVSDLLSGGGSGFIYTDEFMHYLPDLWALDEKYKLTNAKTYNGNQTIPVPNSTSTQTGSHGNGTVMITVLNVDRANERAIYIKRDGIMYRWATFKNS